MKCKHCKNDIPDNSIFCLYCGERVVKERKKKEDIKIPKPRQLKSGKWNIELRAEGQSITEDTAEQCIAKAKAIRAGFFKAKSKVSSVTVGECIDEYIKNRENVLSPSTIRGYKRIRRTRFTKLMNKPLNQLSNTVVQGEINSELSFSGEGKVISPKTLKDAYMLVKCACTTKDPHSALAFKGIALPMPQPAVYTTLNIGQIATLMQGLSQSECELPLLIAIWLGLRRSEILALKKSDFNFDNNTVTIHSALVENSNNKYVEKGTKAASSVRVISCPEIIMSKVKSLPDGRIYTNSPDYMRRCLHRLCDNLGIPQIRLHDLRHINASIMAVTMSEKYSMERGGWSNVRTMQGRYQHIFDNEKVAADKRTDDFFVSLLNGTFTNANTNEAKKP